MQKVTSIILYIVYVVDWSSFKY